MEALFDALGGLGDIIRPGDAVGIKINLTGGLWNAANYERQVGLPPGETYWTHPEVLRAVGELVRDAGAGDIYVLEANGDDWAGFASYGYVEAANHVGATFVNLNGAAPYRSFVARPVGSGAFIYESFTQNALLGELDCLVSLAKSKQHAEAGVTHGMKNLVGLIPFEHYNGGNPNSRQAIHQHRSYDGDTHSNLCRVVLDLNAASPLQLVVNDAVRTVLGGEGPWHALTPASYDTFVASKDAVAADVVATQVLGFDPTAEKGSPTFPESLNYFRLAEACGMGTADPEQIDVVRVAATGVEQDAAPAAAEAFMAYPNPFETEVTLDVTMRRHADATLVVYDVRGRRVRTLVRGALPVGRSTIVWDGCDERGGRVGAGVYLAVLTCGGRRLTRKVARL